MRLVVDRIEEGIVICDILSETGGGRKVFPLRELPPGIDVREGDVLDYTDDKITPNPKATRERKEHIRQLMKDVFP